MSTFALILLIFSIWVIGGPLVFIIDFYTAGALYYDEEDTIKVHDLITMAIFGFFISMLLWLYEFGRDHGWYAWFPQLHTVIFRRKIKGEN